MRTLQVTQKYCKDRLGFQCLGNKWTQKQRDRIDRSGSAHQSSVQQREQGVWVLGVLSAWIKSKRYEELKGWKLVFGAQHVEWGLLTTKTLAFHQKGEMKTPCEITQNPFFDVHLQTLKNQMLKVYMRWKFKMLCFHLCNLKPKDEVLLTAL